MSQEADADADARLAADMQLAYELQAQQEQEDAQEQFLAQAQLEQDGAQEQFLAQATNEAASNTNILGGNILDTKPAYPRSSGGKATTTAAAAVATKNSKNPAIALGNMWAAATAKNNRNHYLHDDGSSAMESNTSLLYVPCEIRGRVVEMMVDSGSQTSVISSSMMNKLKLQKRLNTRYQGVAAGVGAAAILGRIEKCPVLIGAGVEFNLYFLVIDVPHDMLILGIDQMRRFKCMIDLEHNMLIFGGAGGVEVPFLPPDVDKASDREQCTVS